MISKERARNNFHILKLTRLPFYAIFSLTTWSIYHKCYSYFVRVPNLKKFILIFLTLFIKNVYSYQDQNTITEGTKNFIKKEIQTQHKTVDLKTITVRILDNKTINNKTCINEINYSFPIHSNINKRATVVAECKDENSWKVYIPVNIKFFANAISTKKSLPKLHIINKDDLTRKKINVLQLKDQYFTDPNDIVGLALKSSVKQNTVLTSGLLQEVNYEL